MRVSDETILGIDVGSISANIVSVTADQKILEEYYIRTCGNPVRTVRDFLTQYTQQVPRPQLRGIAFTGTAGKVLARLSGCHFENEIIAQARAIELLLPQVRTVIELGGQDSKLIYLEPDTATGKLRIKDFSMNAVCAAGTGSFLDQQAHRLGLSIEEFSRLALFSNNPPRIAGRCSVFAKSDMIHLQQIATTDYDIVAGLCFAVARNFKSTIGKGFQFKKPVCFQGGVAANAGMRRAFSSVLELAQDQLIIPQYFASMGAIGTTLLAWEHPEQIPTFPSTELFDQGLIPADTHHTRAPLKRTPRYKNRPKASCITFDTNDRPNEAYMGIDVGSISTNLVLIDSNKRVLAKRYLMTAGRPIEAIKRGLREIGDEISSGIIIKGVGTTGSGRYLTADFTGADVVTNEITAQAKAAIHIDPLVDTVFEIGGQDSKFISIHNGVVVDFEMNKVCAAGTGSFLEEQAERLRLSINNEFGELALAAQTPVSLGERCTVFMESDLVHYQQQGTPTENLVAGLCISIVLNYLNKVVGNRKIGNTIFFQGGTAFNAGVVAAFEQVLNKTVIVPEHHDVTGAIGAALLSMEGVSKAKSSFKGFDLSDKSYELSSFECHGCANTCEIKKLAVQGDTPLFYGGRCEKYEVAEKMKNGQNLPDLFSEREAFLESYSEPTKQCQATRGQIGIPRALFSYELLPFFKTFFQGLGYEVVLSEKTNKKIIHQGVEATVAETCFPIKLAHGHVLDLINRGVKKIFIPSIVSFPRFNPGSVASSACPYVQTIPYMLSSAINFHKLGITAIKPVLHLKGPQQRVERELILLGKGLGVKAREVKEALHTAYHAQETFLESCKRRGKEVLDGLRAEHTVLVIISRPYNGCDAGVNLQLPQKLRNMGVLAFPMDFLTLEDCVAETDREEMYWKYGQKILAAAQYIKSHPRLKALYLTNFGCGPDSFIGHFFREYLQGQPYLILELDEHSADAGVMTRIEAFLDSLKNVPLVYNQDQIRSVRCTSSIKDRIMYLPPMSDHSCVLSAAFKACGIASQVISESDEQTLSWGRKFTSGRECYPCILTTGDIVKVLKSPGVNPRRSAFFIPSGRGPCRFGQYHRFHKLVLTELGYSEAFIFAPIQNEHIYEQFNGWGRTFSHLAWQGIVAIDVLGKKLRQIRPYEIYKDSSSIVYHEYLGKICNNLVKRREIYSVLEESQKAFASVAIDKSVDKPRIGIVGEIYIRSNQFGNERLINKIEALGGEVLLAPIAEWILYTNHTAKKSCRENKNYSQFLKLYVKNKIQSIIQHRLERAGQGPMNGAGEPDTKEILFNAEPYLDGSFEGEAILSIGKAIDFIKKRGVNGIITVMPFTCMPGTIVNAVMQRCREDCHDFPVLNISYDGQTDTNTMVRLETFMCQVQGYKTHHNKLGHNSILY